MYQSTRNLNFFLLSLLFFLFSCTKNYDPSIKDAIHKNDWHSTFKEADLAKYALDYPKAAQLFSSLCNQNLPNEEKIYAHNQLIFCRLAMNQDSLATILFNVFEKNASDSSAWNEAQKGDFYYNKALINYRWEGETPDFFFEKALAHYKNAYGEKHLKYAQTLTQLALWHHEYGMSLNISTDFTKKAEKVFLENSNLAPYRAELLLAKSMYMKAQRGDKDILNYAAEGISLLRSNSNFTDEILIGRFFVLKCYAYRLKSLLNTSNDISKIKDDITLAIKATDSAFSCFSKSNHLRKQEALQSKALTHAITCGILKSQETNYKKDSMDFFNVLNNISKLLLTQKQQFALPCYLKSYFFAVMNKPDSAFIYSSQTLRETQKRKWLRYWIDEVAVANIVGYYKSKNNIDSSLYYSSIQICNELNLPFSSKIRFDKELFKVYPFLSILLSSRADIFYHFYQKNNKKINYLDSAATYYTIADSMVFSNVINYDTDIVLNLQKEMSWNFSNVIKVNELLWRKRHDRKYLDNIFRQMDRMKSYLLSKDVRVGANRSDSIKLDEIRTCNAEFNRLKNNLNNSQRLAHLSAQIEHLNIRLQADFPHLYKELVLQYIPTTYEIQKSLSSKNEAIIEYSLTNGQLYSFFISKDSVLFSNQDWAEKTDSIFKLYQLHFNDKNYSAGSGENIRFAQNSKYLYQVLLGRYHHFFENGKINQLTIIPDKELNTIPFDCLLPAKNDEKVSIDYINMPFLVKKVAIAYSPSWKVWNENKDFVLSQNLSIAFYSYGKPWFFKAPLRSAEVEKNAIQIAFSNQKISIFEKNACSKDNFLQKMNQFDLTHLSLHARSNIQNRDNNIIFFNQKNDRLMGFDIVNRKAKRSLLVLSACETAKGDSQNSEGTFSLTRSFFQAGYANIVATLWKVDDEKTGDLLHLFYQNLQQKNASLALQEAKKAFLLNFKDKNNPYFWSGVVSWK